MAAEISQHSAAVIAACLPVLQPQSGGHVLDIPIDGNMPQPPDRPFIKQRLCLSPRHDLGEVEIHHRRKRADLPQHRGSPRKVGRHRLFDEHGLAVPERRDGDLRLHARRGRNGDCVDIRPLDHLPPIAEGVGDRLLAGQRGGARRIAARQRNHLAARIEAKGRKLDLAPVVRADNADADQGGSRRGFRFAATSKRPLRAAGTETSWQSHSRTIADRPAPTVAP